MELNLNDLAATLTIGAFFIFGMHYAIRHSFKTSIIEAVFEDFNPETKKYVIGAVLLTFSFIVGMVIEDASNRLLKEDRCVGKKPNRICVNHILIESDRDMRHDVFTTNRNSLTRQAVDGTKPQTLIKKIDEPIKKIEADVKKSIKNEKKQTKEEIDKQTKEEIDKRIKADFDLKNKIQDFYYIAKNRVFRNGSYYDELKKIQLRIDFSRALFATSLLLLIISILLGFTKLILFYLERVFYRYLEFFRRIGKTHYKKRREERFKKYKNKDFNSRILYYLYVMIENFCSCWRLLATSIILLTICLLSAYTYEAEEREYSKRVYGYYISIESCECK